MINPMSAQSGYGSYGSYGMNQSYNNMDTENIGRARSQGTSSDTGECQTCKNRKYVDGSNENVSFKSAAHISPGAAASRVRGHEAEHVSNAYSKAAEEGGKVLRASVSIHTAVCPECGRTYVSGGTTNTVIAKNMGDTNNPYQQNKNAINAMNGNGKKMNFAI